MSPALRILLSVFIGAVVGSLVLVGAVGLLGLLLELELDALVYLGAALLILALSIEGGRS